MKKQWVLKKDLPLCPEGTEGKERVNASSVRYAFHHNDNSEMFYSFSEKEMQSLPDFFECREVLWRPGFKDRYFYPHIISGQSMICEYIASVSDANVLKNNLHFKNNSSVCKLIQDFPALILQWRRENPECE